MSTVAHISLQQYEHMVETGCFDGKFRQRVELIQGEIRQMTPIGTQHAHAVSLVTEWGYAVFDQSQVRLRVQMPVRIEANDSEPEPDFVLAKRKDYSRQHPEPRDVLLLVEIADSSLATDRGEKANLYAQADIADYWIVNLADRCVEVFRKPENGKFRDWLTFRDAEEITPLAFPKVRLSPSQVFTP